MRNRHTKLSIWVRALCLCRQHSLEALDFDYVGCIVVVLVGEGAGVAASRVGPCRLQRGVRWLAWERGFAWFVCLVPFSFLPRRYFCCLVLCYAEQVKR